MPLKEYKRGNTWHYRGTVAGRRLRGSTGTQDKATALQFISQVEARAWKSRLDGPETILTFADAAMLYRSAGKPTRFLEQVEDHWKDAAVKTITAGAIRQSAVVIYPNAGPATRNRQVITPTQAVINHAAEMELCHRITVSRFTEPKAVKTPITWEWVQAFMVEANPRLGALACFLLMTGARISEAVRLDWSDVNLIKSTATLRMTKNDEGRMVHLPVVLVVALSNVPERDGAVFGYTSRHSARSSWDRAVRRAGIEPLTFHCCRHGFATALLHKKIDPVTVAELGGWKTPAHVFKTYGHAMRDKTITDIIAEPDLTQKRHSRDGTDG